MAGAPSPDRPKPMEAFFLAASFMAVLIALVIIRFAIIAMIDCCFGEEYLLRQAAEFCRKVCPWWHRRTVPAELVSDADNTPSPRTVELANRRKAAEAGLAKTQKLLVNQLLPSRTLRKRDLEEIHGGELSTRHVLGKPDEISCGHSIASNESAGHQSSDVEAASMPITSAALCEEEHSSSVCHHDESSSGSHSGTAAVTNLCSPTAAAASCSICLQELRVGQSVCRSRECGHWFHADCLRQWVVRREGQEPTNHNRADATTTAVSVNIIGSNHCPNCRSSIVPQQALDDILGVLRRHELSQRE
jgi:RING-like zinc finger